MASLEIPAVRLEFRWRSSGIFRFANEMYEILSFFSTVSQRCLWLERPNFDRSNSVEEVTFSLMIVFEGLTIELVSNGCSTGLPET